MRRSDGHCAAPKAGKKGTLQGQRWQERREWDRIRWDGSYAALTQRHRREGESPPARPSPARPRMRAWRGSAERAALGPRWAMASILDEYEDSLHRSASVPQGRASVGIPHSGTCAPGPPVCGLPADRGRRGGSSGWGAGHARLCCLEEVCHRVCVCVAKRSAVPCFNTGRV